MKAAILPLMIASWVAPHMAQETQAPKRASRGEAVYNQACAGCHGRAGDGMGPAAVYIHPNPRDFTQATYKFRSTPNGELPTDADLVRTISGGLSSTMMPGFEKILSPEDIREVVVYIKSFSEEFKDREPETPIEIPEPTPQTPEAVAEGKALFMMMECWNCHGPKGRGNGPSVKDMVDYKKRPIRPLDFTSNKFKAGGDLKTIYRTFNTGINGTPMPSFADVFVFGGGDIGDVSRYQALYDDQSVEALKSYFQAQPSDEEVSSMSESQVAALVNRRKWSLVHYVRSLVRHEGLMALFTKDTEVTP